MQNGASIKELRKQNEEFRKQITLLDREVKRLLQGRGGSHLIDEGQGTLFGDDLPAPVADPEPEAKHANEAPDGETPDDPIKKAHKPKKRARKVDASALPRTQVVHELPENERVCPDTGVVLVPIGEKVFEELDPYRAEAERVGAQALLARPFTPRELLHHVHRFMIPEAIEVPTQ